MAIIRTKTRLTKWSLDIFQVFSYIKTDHQMKAANENLKFSFSLNLNIILDQKPLLFPEVSVQHRHEPKN